jgi:predicted dehydrogenase
MAGSFGRSDEASGRIAVRSPRTLRGGIIGYGFISERGHLPAYGAPGETDFRIVAVADTCARRRERAREKLPRARIYPNHLELLEAERVVFDERMVAGRRR